MAKTSTSVTHVEYPPVLNAMDYLEDVVDRLSGEPQPRDLKYAVLHLQAAAEVMLKARLRQEHWSLVFKIPGHADRARFENGDFESCGTADTISRLRGIIDVDIPRNVEDELKQLARWRNALQHYGLKAPALAVESRAASILDFLLTFLKEHLIPALTDDDAPDAGPDDPHDAFAVQQDILRRLSGIRSVIKVRMDRLQPALAPHSDLTVECPDCGQFAVIVGSMSSTTCLFCAEEHYDPENFASFYVGVGLGLEWDEQRTDWPVETCPACSLHAVVLEARTSAAPNVFTPICFACGTITNKS